MSEVVSGDAGVVNDSMGYILAKYIIDFVLGWFFLLLSMPVILLAALAIRIESKGNPFFLQSRIGKNGKQFKIVKLRGMYTDARERFPDLYDYSTWGEKQSLDFHFHYDVDPRVTKVGSFVRRTSIDELPNFINVVLGDMSMVGPRPEVPDVFDMYGQFKDTYMSVKPGITCVSKCTGRDSLTKQQTLEMDMEYVQNRTLLGDLSIIAKTAFGVLLRKDVH